MKINVWHSIEQAESMHQWQHGMLDSKHAYAKGGHFKHML